MKKYEFLGIIAITVLIIILIVHITAPNPSDKVFENQFIKFNYSSNFNLVDKSNSTSLFVIIYDGDPADKKNAIGTIFIGDVNKTKEESLQKTAVNGYNMKKTTISGYDAVLENQGDPGAEIYLNSNKGLFILVNPQYKSDVEKIINSVIIKKAPTDVTSKTLFYEMNH